MNEHDVAWDGRLGTAGGATFGAALQALSKERATADSAISEALGLDESSLATIYAGSQRLGVSALALLVQALRLRPIEFMQKSGLLSLQVYAYGLDPLFFLPEGPLRYDARIYMREINPRHQVPEGDMTKRNPILKALLEDPLLDPLGRIEVELAYLLRVASQGTGGTL
ncbi:MAG TPA: hypothetical protein VMV73_02000 [Candidatus Dormibacteraeota bacterium]|nr:hypothetical protein [Candidatus Dormibacteraeota bacterium]